MSKRIKIGDLIEFKSSYGKIRYAQITHNQKDYGYLLTLFKTEYDHQVDDLSNLLTDEVQFRVFFLLQNAIKQSLVTKLENFEVRDDLKGLPRFKGLKPLQFTSGKYEWAIWEDGVTVKPYNAKISIDEKKYPVLHLIDHETLIYQVDLGWRDGDLPYKDNEYGTGENWRWEDQKHPQPFWKRLFTARV